MKIRYDAEVDVLVIRLRSGSYAESDEVAPNIIVDFDQEGNPLAIEILNAKQTLQLEETLQVEFPFVVSQT